MKSNLLTVLALYGFIVLGVFLLAAPWTPVWERATIGLTPTAVGPWIGSGWVRGLVSGLGALDLLVALQIGGELWRHLSSRGGDSSGRV